MNDIGGPRARPSAPSSRGTATALRIERSAVALVLQHGYDATTVDMICADAGVSQRTFFNHFATKDAAVIGTAQPRLDEQRVRAFIASNDPDILAEATTLVSVAMMDSAADHDLLAARMRAITSSPVLMQRQLERFTAIEEELATVIEYRLTRVSSPDDAPERIAEQSRLTAMLLAGALRYTAGRVMRAEPATAVDALSETRALLVDLLPKLSGGAPSAS